MRTENVTEACPWGHIGRTVKNGTQRGYQRRLCKECRKQFREDSHLRFKGRVSQQAGRMGGEAVLRGSHVS